MVLNNYKKMLASTYTYSSDTESVSDLRIKTLSGDTLSSLYYSSSNGLLRNFLTLNLPSISTAYIWGMLGKDTTVTENDYTLSNYCHGTNNIGGVSKRGLDENGKPFIDRILTVTVPSDGTYTSWGVAIKMNSNAGAGNTNMFLIFKGLLNEPIVASAGQSVSVTVRFYP